MQPLGTRPLAAVESLSGATTAGRLLSLVERTPGSAAAAMSGITTATAWVFDLCPTDHQVAGTPLSLRHSDGEGRYLIASRVIEAGELLLVERPLLLAGAPIRGEAAWAKSSLVAFCSASTTVQSAVLALHSEPIDHPSVMVEGVRDQVARCKGATWRRDYSDATLTEAMLVFQLNAIPLDYAYPQRSSLFEVGSKFNHSCDANAFYEGREGLGSFTALRAISVGEPVTLNYIGDDAIMSTSGRQRLLQATRLFTCHCCRCVSRVDRARLVPCPGCHERTASGLLPAAVANAASDDTTVHYACFGGGTDATCPWRCSHCATSYSDLQMLPWKGDGLMSVVSSIVSEGLEKSMEDVLIKFGRQLESGGFACSGEEFDHATRMLTATLGARHWTALKRSHLRLRCFG